MKNVFRLVVIVSGFLLVVANFTLPARASEVSLNVINLNESDLLLFIDDVSEITGYTFLVHPDVSGTVSVNSKAKLTPDDLFEVFLSALRVNGYSAIPDAAGIFRIVPEELAIGDAVLAARTDSVFVTEVFELLQFSPVEAAKIIKPLLGAHGRVVANPSSRLLIVVEYASNMPRLRELVTAIDVDASETVTIALRAAPAGEVQEILSSLDFGFGSGEAGTRFTALASPSSNSIILKGSAEAIQKARTLVAEVDDASVSSSNTRVFALDHSDATLVEPVLRQIAEVQAGPSGAEAEGARLAVHVPSNSIVVSANSETLLAMEEVVAQIDARRPQVLVEAIIVEVSDEVERELGLQFLVSGTDGNVPFSSSTFSSAAPNLLSLAGALSGGDIFPGGSDSNLFEQAATAALLGLQGGTFGFGGQSGSTLFGVVLNAIEEDEQSNILSTPSIMTLDNHTAVFSVGQEIPITSGEVLGNANANPFRTVERREVGIILSVRPRVGRDNTVRLDIAQEVSSIDQMIGTATPDFILNQRNLETSVIADDGELIVLGGLIQAVDVFEIDKVPLLGDIPGIGRAFQNKETSRENTNLMVFIRPTIIRDKSGAASATTRNLDYIVNQQMLANPDGGSSLDELLSNYFSTDDQEPPRSE